MGILVQRLKAYSQSFTVAWSEKYIVVSRETYITPKREIYNTGITTATNSRFYHVNRGLDLIDVPFELDPTYSNSAPTASTARDASFYNLFSIPRHVLSAVREGINRFVQIFITLEMPLPPTALHIVSDLTLDLAVLPYGLDPSHSNSASTARDDAICHLLSTNRCCLSPKWDDLPPIQLQYPLGNILHNVSIIRYGNDSPVIPIKELS
jgi:hypothetical protein